MQRGEQPLFAGRQAIAGPGAGAIKYDLLTALLTLAAQGSPTDARLALRLTLLITARYNWRSGTFAVGQREMARLWGVTERTAKRETAAMRERGWIQIATPAARGRVASHAIDLPVLLRATMPHWEAVGPDFAARMVGAPEPAPSNVVALRPAPVVPADDPYGWHRAAQSLRAQDPAAFDAWFVNLVPTSLERGVLCFEAPSRFVADYVTTHHKTRILAAVCVAIPAVRDVLLVAPARD